MTTIDHVDLAAHSDTSRNFSLDSPGPGYSCRTYSLPLEGWAISAASPQVAMEVYSGPTRIARFPLNVRRPDVASLHPTVAWAANSGFRYGLNTLRLPSEFTVELRICLQDGTTLPGAILRGRREPLALRIPPAFNPILLTTLGRTGSTWVSHLLGQHPSIIAYEPFRYEARIASYWIDIMIALADQSSYLQALRGHLSGETWWLGAGRHAPQESWTDDNSVLNWLATDHVENLISFAFSRIDAFYRFVSADKPPTTPAFFLEKVWPGSVTPNIMLEVYEQPREIFLVRDFRDMCASIFAYNRKRGYVAFGREAAESDVDYVHRLARDVASIADSWTARSSGAFLLRYEDLVFQPEVTLGSLFEYLGLDASAATIDAVRERAARVSGDAQLQHQTSASQIESVGRWRRDLHGDVKSVCGEIFRPYLSAFGYSVT
jgi:hypothetical protein